MGYTSLLRLSMMFPLAAMDLVLCAWLHATMRFMSSVDCIANVMTRSPQLSNVECNRLPMPRLTSLVVRQCGRFCSFQIARRFVGNCELLIHVVLQNKHTY